MPPILNPKPCAGLEFNCFYKVWPFAPLDDKYLDREGILDDYDTFVFSKGKWYDYWNEGEFGAINIQHIPEAGSVPEEVAQRIQGSHE